MRDREKVKGTPVLSQTIEMRDDSYVLTMEEVRNLAKDADKPAETLTNLVALIAGRFKSDVCSIYLLEPDRANLVLAATLGLRPQCVGTLRMALTEGLAGLVAEQVRPLAVAEAKKWKYTPFEKEGKNVLAKITDYVRILPPEDLPRLPFAGAWLIFL